MLSTKVDEYFEDTSWLRKENANQNISYSNMKGQIANEAIKEYTIAKYSESLPEVVELHFEGFIHIHDLANGIVPYCNGIDFLQLLNRGLITDRIISKPPKHFDTALNQLINRFTGQQQEWAGAQAAGDFNTLLAPLVAKDNLDFEEVKQDLQRFVFDLNYPSRSGNETPFTNIMLNTKCPEFLSEQSPLHFPDDTYADFEDEGILILEAFSDLMREGDGIGNPFTFPIPTLNLIPSTRFDEDYWVTIGEAMAKFGPFYFMNFIGSGIDPNSIRAMCCRVHIDHSKLADASGRWAYQGSTGSIGVVTINLPRIAYLSKDENEFYEWLDFVLEQAKQSLVLKRKWCTGMIDGGYLPITKEYGTDLKTYFSTIGIIGIPEMTMNLLGEPVWKSKDFVTEVIQYVRDWLKEAQLETDTFWNHEITPGESTAIKFAKADKAEFEDPYILGNEDAVYYSNLVTPANAPLNLFERIDIEEDILPLFTGGTVFRPFLGEKMPYADAIVKLISKIATNSKIPYFDLPSTVSVCQKCGNYMRGEYEICPECGSKCRSLARIVGYYRDITRANEGRLREIRERSISIF